jgi:hypothetical protein
MAWNETNLNVDRVGVLGVLWFYLSTGVRIFMYHYPLSLQHHKTTVVIYRLSKTGLIENIT